MAYDEKDAMARKQGSETKLRYHAKRVAEKRLDVLERLILEPDRTGVRLTSFSASSAASQDFLKAGLLDGAWKSLGIQSNSVELLCYYSTHIGSSWYNSFHSPSDPTAGAERQSCGMLVPQNVFKRSK